MRPKRQIVLYSFIQLVSLVMCRFLYFFFVLKEVLVHSVLANYGHCVNIHVLPVSIHFSQVRNLHHNFLFMILKAIAVDA